MIIGTVGNSLELNKGIFPSIIFPWDLSWRLGYSAHYIMSACYSLRFLNPTIKPDAALYNKVSGCYSKMGFVVKWLGAFTSFFYMGLEFKSVGFVCVCGLVII